MFKKSLLIAALLVVVAGAGWCGVALRPGPQLWVYSTKGDLDSIKELVSKNALDRQVLGRALYHNLRRAAASDPAEQVETIKLLLSYGADVNFKAVNGQTPLMMAVYRDKVEAVKVLLENGASAEIKDNLGRTALDLVRSDGYGVAISNLLKAPPASAPVQIAAPTLPPKVLNMDLYLEGDDVVMDYDLASSNPACVKVVGSLNGGNSFDMHFKFAEGDVGEGVKPGNGKRIIWRTKRDYPKGIDNYDVLIDIVASPTCK